MHVSEEEQLKRFEARRNAPLKSWKLTDEDWRNREKRPEYEQAVEDMLAKTEQPGSRWHVVAGDSKRFARVEVLRTVIARIEEGMRASGMEPPQPLS
jgi:polyphosphate kinase 2 (PPK2 family)